MPTTSDLLDLHGVAARATSYRFDLLDRDEAVIGELHPYASDATPIITHDTSRFVTRDVSSFNLSPVDLAAVNVYADRVMPWMLLEDGTEWPLGIYLFADATRPDYGYGPTLASTLMDKGLILEQAVEHTVGVSTGVDIRAAIISLLAEVNISAVVDTAAGTVVGAPIAWPGGTPRSQVLAALCGLGGYLQPWFDHYGVCRVQRTIDPDDADVDIAYDSGRNIYAASSSETTDLATATNRVIVISSDAVNQAFVGVYDVPAGLPYSFYARGFRVVEVINAEGLTSQGQADAAAKAYAQRNSYALAEQATFDGPPDPRHDGNNVVSFNGVNWLEIGWVLPLSAFGPMTHTVQRVST